MAVTAYTTADEIRAALGVSPEELEDGSIVTQLNATRLDDALYGLSPNLADNYLAVALQSTKTRNETRFVNNVSAWCCVYVASLLVTTLPLFAPRVMQSDKDTFERVSDPYVNLRGDLSSTLSSLKDVIAGLYATLFPAETTPDVTPDRTLLLTSVLGTDPVTG